MRARTSAAAPDPGLLHGLCRYEVSGRRRMHSAGNRRATGASRTMLMRHYGDQHRAGRDGQACRGCAGGRQRVRAQRRTRRAKPRPDQTPGRQRDRQQRDRYQETWREPAPPSRLPRRAQRNAHGRSLPVWRQCLGEEYLESATVVPADKSAQTARQWHMAEADHASSSCAPVARQIAVHHSRGSPSPPTTAITSAPAMSRRTGMSCRRGSLAAATRLGGSGAAGTGCCAWR